LRSLCCRWDCFWYASVVLYGYDAVPARHPAGDAANWAFLPLFPLLAGLWHGLAGFGFEDALIVTGTLALPVCVYLIIEFVDAGDIAVSPWVSGSLVAFGPYALSAHTGYSEPLRGAARMQLMPTIDAPAVIQRNLAHLELPGVRAGPSLPFTGRAARAGQPVCCPCCGLGRLDEKPSGRRQEGVPRLSSLE